MTSTATMFKEKSGSESASKVRTSLPRFLQPKLSIGRKKGNWCFLEELLILKLMES